ncbi:MAG: TIGR04283 family arsenosugar biosynthesis glycosyltransferase [Bosea sp. (in: a-proteobacteria)]
MMISTIIPALNEAASMERFLFELRAIASNIEIILADGGSTDATTRIASRFCNAVVSSDPGRARQMNAGAARASGDVLLFLHADTRLPPNFEALIHDAISAGADWGRFDVRIEGRSRLLPMIAAMMNWRSKLTRIATGDQAMFMTRSSFEQVGGFPDQRLMEDIEMSKRLKRLSKPACLAVPVMTAGRRWDEKGALPTIWLMWRLRFAYWRGADPEDLAIRYGYGAKPGRASDG